MSYITLLDPGGEKPLNLNLCGPQFLLSMSSYIAGDLESSYARCCALGANWARVSEECSNFPAPVPGESTEHQPICITTASICCLRYYRCLYS